MGERGPGFGWGLFALWDNLRMPDGELCARLVYSVVGFVLGFVGRGLIRLNHGGR
jgi:hypothetical protein